MFAHNFKYSLKTLCKNKILIFWTLAFPLILGTLFQLAFSDIEKNEQLDVIDIAIVQTDWFQSNTILQETFKSLSDKNSSTQLFSIKYTDEEEAQKLLQENKISGYVSFQEDSPKITVATSGINQTVLKYVVEEMYQTEAITKQLIEEKLQTQDRFIEYSYNVQQEIYKEVMKILQEDSLPIKDISSTNLSYTMIEFYTLIAMTCLYGGILGMTAVNQNLANMSHNGKRISVGPTKKKILIISSALASFLIQLVGISLLFLYTTLILHIDYGPHFPQIILLTMTGCFAGLSFGIMIATLIKANDNLKTGIMIAATMFGCFLSGMMGITMKYIVDKNLPLINKLNPANMITDGFYSLYYYDTFDRFYQNLLSLILFSGIMLLISIICLRREQYDSI